MMGRSKLNLSCSAWFFPLVHDNDSMCDPWQKVDLYGAMTNIQEEDCPHCLPDCNRIIYQGQKLFKITAGKSEVRGTRKFLSVESIQMLNVKSNALFYGYVDLTN